MLLGGAAFLGPRAFPSTWAFAGGVKESRPAPGVFTVLVPVSAPVGLVTYGVVFALTRVSGLGSLLGLAAVGVTVAIREPRLLVLYAICAAVMVWRHWSEICRIDREAAVAPASLPESGGG